VSIRRAQDERIEGTPDGLNAVSEIMDVPDAPTIGAATNVGTSRAYNDGSATVAFTAPTTGGTPTTYTATSTPGSLTGTAASSPVTVTGLQSATSYTFAVKGTNVNAAASPDSAASSSITATTVPQAPTIGTATLSTTTASVPFTTGATGGSTIIGYTATSSPGSLTGTSASSPISVTGLSYSTAYTFTVTATNANGTSAASSASNSVTPIEPKSGYALGGGGTNGVIYTTDKLNFANDTNSTISGNEISAGGNMGFADSGTAGYSTGGGFPGIPLAIMFPEAEFTMIDSIAKKIKVAESVSESLGLENTDFVVGRVEQLNEPFHFITARAVAATEQLYRWTHRYIEIKEDFNSKINGFLFLKGGDLKEEFKALKDINRKLHIQEVPLTEYFKEEFFETKKLIYIFQ
jgi:hypothetical protein